MDEDPGYVWLAYYGDWSGFAVFNSELHALRYAVDKSMQVARLPTGVDAREAVKAQ